MAMESNIGDTNDLGLHADMIACAMDVQRVSFDFTLLLDFMMPCISLFRLSGMSECQSWQLSIIGYTSVSYVAVLISSRIMDAAISRIRSFSDVTLALASLSQLSFKIRWFLSRNVYDIARADKFSYQDVTSKIFL